MKVKKNRDVKDINILMYGFDQKGFTLPLVPIELKKGIILHFVAMSQSVTLDRFDGVVIPQGIFEVIEYNENYTDVKVSKQLMLEKERQIQNLLKEKGWVCFLVGQVVDKVSQGLLDTQSIKNSDLCKKVMNYYDIERKVIEGEPVEASENEFINFIRCYGTAQTIFYVPDSDEVDMRVLANLGEEQAGIEFSGRIFFLPFHLTKRDADTLIEVAKELTRAILDYRQKRILEIPTWVNSFQFNCEISLGDQVDKLLKETSRLQTEMKLWSNYKGILVASGEHLRQRLIQIFETYFNFKVDPIDEGREDAKILDESGKPILFIESKGTKGGIRREHVNQVDSHRERNGLTDTVPGALLINNQMSIESVEDRLATEVPNEHIIHAKNSNILIIRTIDLLFLMKFIESKNKKDRKTLLLKLFNSGGGWLSVNDKNYKIMKGD